MRMGKSFLSNCSIRLVVLVAPRRGEDGDAPSAHADGLRGNDHKSAWSSQSGLRRWRVVFSFGVLPAT